MPIYLVGHSHGGNVCIAAANLCRTPERIRGLILLSTPFLNFEDRSSWLENISSPVLIYNFLYVLVFILGVMLFPASFDWLLSSLSSSSFTLLLHNEANPFLKGAWSVLCYVNLYWLVCMSVNAVYNSSKARPLWSPLFQFVRPKVLILNHGLDEAYWVLKLSSLFQRAARALSLMLFGAVGLLPTITMFLMFLKGSDGFLHNQDGLRLGFVQTFLIPSLATTLLSIVAGAIVALMVTRLAAYALFLDYTFGLPSKKLFRSTIKITRLPNFVWSRESIVWLDKNQVFFLYARTLVQSFLRRSLVHSFAYVEPAAIKSVASWINGLELDPSTSNSVEF